MADFQRFGVDVCSMLVLKTRVMIGTIWLEHILMTLGIILVWSGLAPFLPFRFINSFGMVCYEWFYLASVCFIIRC